MHDDARLPVDAPAADRRRLRLLPPGHHAGWTPYAWLVYLVPFVLAPAQRGPWHGRWGITAVATAVFLVTYFRIHWERGPRLLALIGVLTALGVACTWANPGAGVFFVYAASFAPHLDRPRDVVRALVAVVALGVATGWVAHAPDWYWMLVLVFAPLIGGVNLHFTQVGRANAATRRAQAEVARLAAVAERERIARDLHDVLGHTLSLIILKSELAGKLAERDPPRAAREIREVEQVSRAALAEVREAIRGYRATLDDEAARARRILDTAGIRAEIAIGERPPDRARDEVLALVLRETVTNVVRHSGAAVCRVRAGCADGLCTLTVADDGQGVGRAGAVREGAGLRGVRERVEALGGTVACDGARGMRVTVAIPAPTVAPGMPSGGAPRPAPAEVAP